MDLNPNQLTQTNLSMLLNSTDYGEVISVASIRKHRGVAGTKFFNPKRKTYNLIAFIAYLAERKHKKTDDLTDAYEKHKIRVRERSKKLSISGRDIGAIPAISNPDLRELCRYDFKLYCEKYHPEQFPIAWSGDHIKAIAAIEESVLNGGLFALAMPRGSGKTTLVEIACVWAIIYGHRQFIFLVGADEVAAENMLTSIKSQLEHNARLLADFPEVCFPINKIDGEARKTSGQLCEGNRTQISWKSKTITLPTIEGSPSSGSTIRIAGITGKIRGAKKPLVSGESIRPDLVIIDDPQTDESANSVSQCASRLDVVTGAILGLAGVGKQIAAFMPCTIIREGDLADTILDKEVYPEWQGMKTKMLIHFPDDMEIWEKYSKIRAESLSIKRNISLATQFYKDNRDQMDKGALASWKERFRPPHEISAIQSAMELFFLDEYAFFSEYQNEPKSREAGDDDALTAMDICTKINGYERRQVPHDATLITSGVDVQKGLLFYVVKAWSENSTEGYVIDYGVYPKQDKKYFTKNNFKNSYMDNPKVKGGLGAKLTYALKKLTSQIMDREYLNTNGVPMSVDQMLIDANWAESKITVYNFCRSSGYGNRIRPSHGRGYQATSIPMTDIARKEGEKKGHNWVITYPKNAQTGRYVFFDTNYWKSWLHDRFAVGIGGAGSLSLWGDSNTRHIMFADHIVAEYTILVEARQRKVNEWKEKVKRPDNDWLDCCVMACVAASMRGLKLAGVDQREVKSTIKKKVKKRMSDKMNGRR